MEFTLLGAAAVAMSATWLWTRRDPVLQRVSDPFGTLLSATVVGLVAGRVTAMVATGTNPLSLDLFLVRGGVSTIGATIGALAWLAWSVRGEPGTADQLAPAALVGLAGWHLGCLVRGACLGAAANLPWAWSLPDSPVTRHPVELYAAAALIAGAMLVTIIRSRRAAVGVTALTAVGLASMARFITEPLRLTLGDLEWFYGLGAVVGLLGAATLAVRYAHQRRELRRGEHQPEQNQEDL